MIFAGQGRRREEPGGCAERREQKGERRAKEKGIAARQVPRPLREDGYKREDDYKCGDGYILASRPRSYGLEGRPFIARGEPRFAAEPRDHAPTNASGEP